jgi:uncharacterized protein (DUF169 family)
MWPLMGVPESDDPGRSLVMLITLGSHLAPEAAEVEVVRIPSLSAPAQQRIGAAL